MTFLRITKIVPESWTEEVEVHGDLDVLSETVFRARIWFEVKGGVYVRDLLPGENLDASTWVILGLIW